MRVREAGPTSESAAPPDGETRRERRWKYGIWLFVLVGVVISVGGARAWHAKLQAQDRAAFRTRASDLALTAGSNLSRDTDFVASVRSLVTSTAALDNATFKRAIFNAGALQRYPGGVGYAYYERVPGAGMGAFRSRLAADPPNADPFTSYSVIPAGARADYCLLRLEYLTAPLPATFTEPLGLDVCASPGPFSFASAAASSQFSVPILAAGMAVIAAPAYSGGVAPATVAGRRASFSGWIGVTFATAGLVPTPAIRSGLQIEVLFQNAGSKPTLVARSGPAPHGQVLTESLEIQADGPWTIRVEGVATGPGSTWAQAGAVFFSGLLVTGLLFGFVQVLALSRRHAVRLVNERTVQLHHQALHDALTGLPNRALILDRAAQMLARGRRDRAPTAMLFVDLDGFKDVNDTYGHSVGDRLLQAVAERITATLRQHDSAGRFGGDEFVVLVEGAEAGPEMVAERLLAVLRQPFVLDANAHVAATAQASIGIAVGSGQSAEELIRDADIALHQAKAGGGDRYAFFSPDLETAARDRVELTMELRGALSGGELFLAYQPTFSLRDMTVNGVEALIRWRHPTRGIVPPDEFIPIAEETGLIIPIGRWVLETACAEAVTWQSPGRRLSVAVNVSGRQLDTDELVDDVRAALDHSGLEPALLTIEITETSLMHDPAEGVLRLRALKGVGVRLSIDDFGTGYSSLTYLRQFPADALKIDRSFISAMADSPESTVIVRTLIQLGKALGIETLAEGIEERTQLEHLQSDDCDSGQGFIFARPLSPAALQDLIGPLGSGPAKMVARGRS